VVENRWLDHLKIFCWHPWLAEQPEIRSVCGDQHLRILLQHWLNQANLNLPTPGGQTNPHWVNLGSPTIRVRWQQASCSVK